jgi:FKBP-type peptidyl-prolyl cis-trans isomerase FkpA
MNFVSLKYLVANALLILITLMGCNGCKDKKQAAPVSQQQLQQDLIDHNRAQLQEETKRIKKFIEDKKWPMTETATGLYYWIYEPGTGEVAKNGKDAIVDYTVSLLDGTQCYKTTPESPTHFLIGQDNVESGLHEVILLMKVGDHARLVLPSRLAFGVTGDSDKVPQNASVVYDLHLIALR